MVITADAGTVQDDGARSLERAQAGSGFPGGGTRRRRPAVALSVAAATTPILVAGLRAAARGWTPTGDDSYSAIRAWDVFSSNVPLLGTWSSATLYTGHHINHPGALHFDLLAVPVRLLGHGPGTAVGMALLNAAAVALAGWLVARRLGTAAATATMGLAALLAWSMGSEILYSPWSQHAPLWPFALFVVAVWCAVAGDRVALPVMVVAGSYALQTHLSYALLVPGLLVFGLGAVAWRELRARRRHPAAWPERRDRALRWAAVTAGTWLVVSLQPLAQQVAGKGEGNLTALWHSASADAATPGLGPTVRALGGTVALPPAWLPPSFGSPAFDVGGDGPPTLVAGTALVALAAALAVLGWRARRRGSVPVAAGAATGLVALLLALVTIPRAPVRWGMAPSYLRWMWPLGMVLWAVLAAGLLDELRARRGRPTAAGGPRARAERAGEPGAEGLGAGCVGGATGADGADGAGRGAGADGVAHSNGANGAGGADVDPGDDDGVDRGAAAIHAGGAGRGDRAGQRGALVGLVIAVVAALGALPTVDNGSASPPWTVDAVRAVDDEVVAAAEDVGSVLVELSPHLSSGAVGPPLLVELQAAGVPFHVEDPALVRQLGRGRRHRPGDATARLTVVADPDAPPGPGQRVVARWSDLSGAEQDELARLARRVEDLVAEHGLPLTDEARGYLVAAGEHRLLDRIAARGDDPREAVSTGLVLQLWAGNHADLRGEPLLDPDRFPAELLDRWSDLQLRRQERAVTIFIGPV